MQNLLSNLKITINEKLYVKDPETSELGRNILKNSILLIDEIGFEAFTFKKLGEKIQSNESSIYRYFENKNKLLVYLSTDVNSTEFVNLGDLKGISGDFTYNIPAYTDVAKYKIVNIWCVDFSVSFGTAELK